MASCYDRVSCSVDSNTGALTINTKHGSCTVVPGSTVTFTEDETGYIIAIDGQPYLIPKIEPGDDVDFTETEDAYIITINNTPHSIPKCRYYRNCEGEILDECERIVTCDDLESRGFISCFNENDFNITIEEIDGDLTRCLNIAWDRLCAEAETIPADNMPDNAQVLYCTGGEVKKSNFGDSVAEVIDNYCFEPNNAGSSCGDLSYAVWQECPDGTGYKLASFSSDSAVRFTARAIHVPWLPQDQNYVWPTSSVFQNGLGPYTFTELRDDDDFGNGTIDETRIRNNIVGEQTVELDCPTTFNYDLSAIVATNEVPDMQTAYDMRTKFIRRWSVDGGPWQYVRVANDNRLQQPTSDNALTTTLSGSQSIGRARFPAGTIRVQTLFLTDSPASTAVPIRVNTTEPGTGTAHAYVVYIQAVG